MNKRAFTLIELLVVIAIIGVIAGFLVPVLGRARENARRAMCANNLRQIGMAMHMYIDEHDFKFPEGAISWVRSTRTYYSWMSEVSPYLDNTTIFNCPDYKYSSPLDATHASYGYNTLGLCIVPGQESGKDINSVRSPSQCIMVADSSEWPSDPTSAWCTIGRGSDSLPGKRHSGGANVVFVDGHVGWHLQSFLLSQDEDWWNY